MEIKISEPDENKKIYLFQLLGDFQDSDKSKLDQQLRKKIIEKHLIIDLSGATSISKKCFDVLMIFASDVNEGIINASDDKYRELALIEPPDGVWAEGLDLVFGGMCLNVEGALNYRDFM